MTDKMLPKDELLKAIRSERELLDDRIAELSVDQLQMPIVDNGWSIKDIYAHITAWEQLAIDRIQAGLTGHPLKYELIQNDTDVDRFNAKIYAENKNSTIKDVLESARISHLEFYDLITTLDEGFIAGSLPFDWANTLSVYTVISANTHWHYKEHRLDIEKWQRGE